LTDSDSNEIVKTPEIEEVTEEQVHFMVEFAQELSKGGMFGNNVFTPDLINARLRDISFNPTSPTQDMLDKAMANPKESEDNLRKFSENFELQSMPYKRLISYLSGLLAFDYTITCTNATEDDYKIGKNKNAYQKELDKVYDFLDKFNVKKEFAGVTRQLLRNDAYFFCFRNEGDRYIFQELDNAYCKITARFDYGFLMDYNLVYFLQPATDLKMFPDFFSEALNKMYTETQGKYVPHTAADARNSLWAYWTQVPATTGFVFKLNQDTATRIPYFAGLFQDLNLQPLLRNLQRDKSIISAAKIVFGEVPLLDKSAKTTVKDMFALDAKSLANFLTLLKSGVGSAIKVAAAPLQGVQALDFPSEENIYLDYLNTAVSSSGVNSNLIFTGTTRPNIRETELSLSTDEQLMEQMVYPMAEDFIEYQLSRITKKYRFKLKFEGSNFFTNRTQRIERLTPFMQAGIILPQKYAAALGMEPREFERQMQEAKAKGFVDGLTPIVMASQMAGVKDNGAPKKSDSEISESGSQTRDDGGNLGKGGKS
jgi:hypothetical protein